MAEMISEGTHPADAAEKVFRTDIDALNKCDVLLILLDGRTVDEGAAFEFGYAFALGKTCVGLQTDVRRLLTTGNNPMIDCGLNLRDTEKRLSRLGLAPADLAGILITHEHSDHAGCAFDFAAALARRHLEQAPHGGCVCLPGWRGAPPRR